MVKSILRKITTLNILFSKSEEKLIAKYQRIKSKRREEVIFRCRVKMFVSPI